MSDLISRQDAISLVDRPIVPTGDAVYDNAREDERESIKDELTSLPSADSTEPGRWEIKTETDEYGIKRPKLVCSKCKKEPAAWDLTELFEYCPNCGERMKGADE